MKRFVAALVLACAFSVNAADRPNILWLVSEDNSAFLGCYGDEFATTPNLDRLAREGVVYDHAFSTAPVCAATRSSLITGCYPPSMGTQHMRSGHKIPAHIRFFPQYLREAGYFCTNRSKTDYNSSVPKQVWDGDKKRSHYRFRKDGQPFFAIFNIGTSHESSIHRSQATTRHSQEKVPIPPYHPDTPEMRHDWAQYYDKVEDMDKQMGDLLKELEESGLAEDTIVFYYSDHGGILGRSKRFLFESGTHIPFIVRVPEKWKHYAPGKPGTRTDRIVVHVDLAATVLSLAGIEPPKHMQGQAFLGKYAAEPRDYAFNFRGRMDERYDFQRAVRDTKFRYVKNYNPHRPYLQYLQYLWRAPSMRSWDEAYRAGNCNEIQSMAFEEKPAEELYDITKDPHNVHNLAGDPAHAQVLERMRKAHEEHALRIHDSGFIPEGLMVEINNRGTIHDYVRTGSYPLDRIMEVADAATSRDPERLPDILEAMNTKHEIMRYWAATGCLILGKEAKGAEKGLTQMLQDPDPDVRITAAEALCHLGGREKALPVIVKELQEGANSKVRLHAINALTYIGELPKDVVSAIEQVSKKNGEDTYVKNAAAYLVLIQRGQSTDPTKTKMKTI